MGRVCSCTRQRGRAIGPASGQAAAAHGAPEMRTYSWLVVHLTGHLMRCAALPTSSAAGRSRPCADCSGLRSPIRTVLSDPAFAPVANERKRHEGRLVPRARLPSWPGGACRCAPVPLPDKAPALGPAFVALLTILPQMPQKQENAKLPTPPSKTACSVSVGQRRHTPLMPGRPLARRAAAAARRGGAPARATILCGL